MPKPTDEQLIANCLAGDKDSFGELYSRFFNPVRKLVGRYLHNQADTDEVTQGVFTKAWEKKHQFDPSKKFINWLLTIAANAALDRLKANKRLVLFGTLGPNAEETLSEIIADSAALPDELAARRQMVQKVRFELAKAELSKESRRLFLLRYEKGLSMYEIAALLGQPRGTIKDRHKRQLAILRRRLKKYWNQITPAT